MERAALVPGFLDVIEAVGFEHLTALQSSVDQNRSGRGEEEQQPQTLTDSDFWQMCDPTWQYGRGYEEAGRVRMWNQELRDDDTEKAYPESVE